MKVIIDSQIAKDIALNAFDITSNPLTLNSENQISLRWPSLLEYLGLGELFTHISRFDQDQLLFETCLEALQTYEEKETLFYMFDHLFAENLKWIKALDQLHASSLLERMGDCQKNSKVDLTEYEKAFTQNPKVTLHDLILYLAWDRMCVCVSRLFDYQSQDPKFIKGLEVLKDCLVESYLHIVQQGRTSPSLFRMFEALFFYQVREERLQTHLPKEWEILSQSINILVGQERLSDVFYIDDAISSVPTSTCYLTSDSPDKIKARLLFAHYMMDKIKSEFPSWNYHLHPKEVLSLTH